MLFRSLDSLEIVKESAFSFCSGVKTLYIPKVKTIQKNGFYCFSALESLDLPETLETIAQGGFYMASKLTKLVLPASITSLGDLAFQSCTGLKKIIFKGTPSGIGSRTFTGCSAVEHLYVPWNYNEKSGAPWGCENEEIHYGDEGWMDHLEEILADE